MHIYSLFYFYFSYFFYLTLTYIYIYSLVLCFIFFFLQCPLSGPVLTYISLLIIPCMIVYVTNKQEPWTCSHWPDKNNEEMFSATLLNDFISCCVSAQKCCLASSTGFLRVSLEVKEWHLWWDLIFMSDREITLCHLCRKKWKCFATLRTMCSEDYEKAEVCDVLDALNKYSTYQSKVLFFLLKKLILLFIKDALNWWNVTVVNTFIMLQNIYISNKCCAFELSIHLWIMKNKMYHSFHKNIGQHNCVQHW